VNNLPDQAKTLKWRMVPVVFGVADGPRSTPSLTHSLGVLAVAGAAAVMGTPLLTPLKWFEMADSMKAQNPQNIKTLNPNQNRCKNGCKEEW